MNNKSSKKNSSGKNQLNKNSSVKPARNINPKTTLFLYVKAGGRCEFDGCNKYLIEHHLTETPGNFAEKAHIYAFKEDGSRGKEEGRPIDINDISNLILLCPECHHLVDDVEPENYSVQVLQEFKKDHEERIFQLTGFSKNRETIPLVFKSLISGRAMDISDREMQEAVAPRYLKKREKVEIDLNIIDQPKSSFWETAKDNIDTKLIQLNSKKLLVENNPHISVFALAPIPLLIYLGSKLSDKIDMDFYQRHRISENWLWQDGLGNTHYIAENLCSNQESDIVVLLINVSGKNTIQELPENIRENSNIYELRLDEQEATPLCLNTKADLERFTFEYIKTLAKIREDHPNKSIHLFPAVPAPVAIVLGRSRLPKADAPLIVYDRDSRNSAQMFVQALTIE